MDPLAIAVTVIVIYIIILLLLNSKGILEKYDISFFGPLLMWRTKRGRMFLRRLARKERFWKVYGSVSLAVTILFGAAIMGLLIWEAFIIVQVPVEVAPSPEMLVGIPGINPIIPVGYGIFALAVAIICHEFAHGILAYVGKIRVKSLGLLLFIFPIGAFVEPDEVAMKKMRSKRRQRIYAVGPATNIYIGIICAIIFSWGFMTSVEPVEDGLVVRSVTEDYPAYEAGLRPWMLITEVRGENETLDLIESIEQFSDFMEQTHPGENLTIIYIHKDKKYTATNVTLADKYLYYSELYPDAEGDVRDIIEGFRGQGFLGISTFSIRDDVIDALATPYRGDSTPLEFISSGVIYVSQPVIRMSPMPPELIDLLVVEGPLEAIPIEMFWLLANTFYWLFWLNLMVGATNALPGIPLDGGYIFKDKLDNFLRRRGVVKRSRNRITFRVILFFSLLILFLILWLVIGPYVGAALIG